VLHALQEYLRIEKEVENLYSKILQDDLYEEESGVGDE